MGRAPSVRYVEVTVASCDLRLRSTSATLAEREKSDATDLCHVQTAKQANSVRVWFGFRVAFASPCCLLDHQPMPPPANQATINP